MERMLVCVCVFQDGPRRGVRARPRVWGRAAERMGAPGHSLVQTGQQLCTSLARQGVGSCPRVRRAPEGQRLGLGEDGGDEGIWARRRLNIEGHSPCGRLGVPLQQWACLRRPGQQGPHPCDVWRGDQGRPGWLEGTSGDLWVSGFTNVGMCVGMGSVTRSPCRGGIKMWGPRELARWAWGASQAAEDAGKEGTGQGQGTAGESCVEEVLPHTDTGAWRGHPSWGALDVWGG